MAYFLQLNSTQLNSTQLNSTQLNSTQLNNNTLFTKINSCFPFENLSSNAFIGEEACLCRQGFRGICLFCKRTFYKRLFRNISGEGVFVYALIMIKKNRGLSLGLYSAKFLVYERRYSNVYSK